MYRKIAHIIKLLILMAPLFLWSAVGDWQSYASLLNWNPLIWQNDTLWAGSAGGLLRLADDEFEVFNNRDGLLSHAKVTALYADASGNILVASGAGRAILDIIDHKQNGRHLDLGLDAISYITGSGANVFMAGKKGLTPGIAHLVKIDGEYIFRDFFDQFPVQLSSINQLLVFKDTLYAGTNRGLFRADLRQANLKPASSWEQAAADIGFEEIKVLASFGERLFFTMGQNLCLYESGRFSIEKSTLSATAALTFFQNDTTFYYTQSATVYRRDNTSGRWLTDFVVPGTVISSAMGNGQLIVGIKDKGILRLSLAGETLGGYIPNSLFSEGHTAMAISQDGTLALANFAGHSLFKEGKWHNLIRSDLYTSINAESISLFAADTLAYTVIGKPLPFDVHISSGNMLYTSFQGVHIDLNRINYEPIVKPGPVVFINLEDFREYGILDTTDDLFDGSEASTAGSAVYVVSRGMAESKDGSVWIMNAHASNSEPLIRILPNGQKMKYSVADSDNKLQVLGREMAFDERNRLWIANQSHRENQPVTMGGITIYDLSRNEWFLLTSSEGLAHNDVFSIDRDIDGSMWVVTAGGVQNIIVPSTLSGGNFSTVMKNNVRPVLNGLGDVNVSKVRIDSRGNKWFLTTDGGIRIYLRNGTWFNKGYGYNTQNSPLLSDVVYDAVFDSRRGIAYLLSAEGLNSVITPWADPLETAETIITYPQPFRAGLDQRLIFANVPDQSTMIISTINGRHLLTLPPTASSNQGHEIHWDGRLDNGDFISRGVYLYFVYNVDGLRFTGKIAIQ
jgi:hypothetical protein